MKTIQKINNKKILIDHKVHGAFKHFADHKIHTFLFFAFNLLFQQKLAY